MTEYRSVGIEDKFDVLGKTAALFHSDFGGGVRYMLYADIDLHAHFLAK